MHNLKLSTRQKFTLKIRENVHPLNIRAKIPEEWHPPKVRLKFRKTHTQQACEAILAAHFGQRTRHVPMHIVPEKVNSLNEEVVPRGGTKLAVVASLFVARTHLGIGQESRALRGQCARFTELTKL